MGLLRHGQPVVTGLFPHNANRRFIKSRRVNQGGGAPPVEITYLLSANFNASDTGAIADLADLETAAPGSVQVGALTMHDTAGNRAHEILANALRYTTGTNVQTFQCAGVSNAITPAMGVMFKTDIVMSSTTNSVLYWNIQSVATLVSTTRVFAIYNTGSSLRLLIFNNAGTQISEQFIPVTELAFTLAIILGGYDINGVPYKAGDTAANFTHGAAMYIKHGGVWELMVRNPRAEASPASLFSQTAMNGNTGTTLDYDNLMAVDVDSDLQATNQPAHLSLFTAANGTLLSAYTPDIGGGWTAVRGTYDINNNQASLINGSDPSDGGEVTIDPGFVPGFCESTFTFSAATNGSAKIFLRFAAFDTCYFTEVNVSNNDFSMYERNSGAPVLRASANVTVNSLTTYRASVRDTGIEISAWLDGDNEISYSTILLNTNTRKGMGNFISGGGVYASYDYFAVWSLIGAQYNVLDNYSGAS